MTSARLFAEAGEAHGEEWTAVRNDLSECAGRIIALERRVTALEAPTVPPDPGIDPEPVERPAYRWDRSRSLVIAGGWACGNDVAEAAIIEFCAATGMALMLTYEWELHAPDRWKAMVMAAQHRGIELIYHRLTGLNEKDLSPLPREAWPARAAEIAETARAIGAKRDYCDGLEAIIPGWETASAEDLAAAADELLGLVRAECDKRGLTAPLMGSDPGRPLIACSWGIDMRDTFKASSGATVEYTLDINVAGPRHAEDTPSLLESRKLWKPDASPIAGGYVTFGPGGFSDAASIERVFNVGSKAADAPVSLMLMPGFESHPLRKALQDTCAKWMK